MPINSIEQIAKIFSTYGPWAICAILIAAVIYLFVSNNKERIKLNDDHKKELTAHENKLDERTDQIMDILTESTAIITQVKNEIRDNRELNVQVRTYLERSEQLNDRLRILLGRLEVKLENVNQQQNH